MRNMPNIINKTFKYLTVTLFLSALFFLRSEVAHAADPSLFLSPNSGTYYLGQTFNVDVMLNSGGNDHIETNLQLNYDQLVLEVLEITNKNLYWDYYEQDYGSTNG